MTDAEAEFVKEGITRYSEACTIVDTFRKLAGSHVAKVLGERLKEQWPAFVPTPPARSTYGKQFSVGERERYGRWIFTSRAGGASGSPVTSVEAGVWWGVPWGAHDTVFYLRCYKSNAMGSIAQDLPPDVNFDLDEKALYVTAGSSLDFESACRRLVEVAAHTAFTFSEREVTP